MTGCQPAKHGSIGRRVADLSLKISPELLELIEYVADQRKESVDDAVHSMLEEIVEIERIRGMCSEQAYLEQKALFGSRKAKRTAADAWEAILAAWRKTRKTRKRSR